MKPLASLGEETKRADEAARLAGEETKRANDAARLAAEETKRADALQQRLEEIERQVEQLRGGQPPHGGGTDPRPKHRDS